MTASLQPATLTIDGVDYLADVGRVEGVELGWEDHGIFTLYVRFTFGGAGQGFGGFFLDAPGKGSARADREPTLFGLAFIMRTTAILGDLTKCVGRRAYVLHGTGDAYGPILGIASIDNPSRSFVPKVDLAKYIPTEMAS